MKGRATMACTSGRPAVFSPTMSDPRIDSPPLFDSHAHLSSFDEFREDLPSVLDAARAAGVVGLIDIGAGGSAKSFERSLAFANRFDWVWATAGVHPHEAKHGSPEVLERLEDIAKEEKIVAIGETGLDYHYDLSPRDVQRDVFAKQLRNRIIPL